VSGTQRQGIAYGSVNFVECETAFAIRSETAFLETFNMVYTTSNDQSSYQSRILYIVAIVFALHSLCVVCPLLFV
jgi:hypothetical protein